MNRFYKKPYSQNLLKFIGYISKIKVHVFEMINQFCVDNSNENTNMLSAVTIIVY